MTERELDELKAAGDVPEWMDLGGYLTLSRGYLLKGETPRDMYRRCAKASATRLKREDLEDRFFDILWKGWLGLASPVASNLGTDRGLPISCYSTYVDDSVDGIMGTTYEIAMLSKNGGGIGSYWGDVRPRGSEIKNNGKSDGVIPFLKILDSTTVGISQGGCYEEGVQVLTSKGFKDFRDLNPDDLIAQLDEERNLSFTLGQKTVRHWEGPMYKFSHPTSLSLGVTPNHRMMVERRKQKNNKKYWPNRLEEISAEDSKFHRDTKVHAAAKRAEVGSLTPLERFRIAFQADGRKTNVRNNNEKFRVYFRIKKERKKERLREIFKDCNLLYTEKSEEGVSSFSVEVSDEYFKPTFDWVDLIDFDSPRAAAFMLELSEWDSGKKKGKSFRYSSTVKENVLVAEAMAAIGGFRTSYSVREADGNRSDLHELHVQGIYRSISGEKITKSKFDYNGNVYCCVVPEGRIIVKDLDGNISVCGNTRRGASSAYLPIEHDDFDEFVDMRRPKGDPNRQCLNIHHGVCISDKFMENVVSGDPEARRRWKKLIKARVETGEPYIFFSDTVDRKRPECYKDRGLDVKASNLCMAGDQRVPTNKGYLTAKELHDIGEPLIVFDGDKPVEATKMRLIEKNAEVYKVTYENGLEQKLTLDHKIPVDLGRGNYKLLPLRELSPGDKVRKQIKPGIFGNKDMQDEAFLVGLWQADGTADKKGEKICIDIWENDFDLLSEIKERWDRVVSKYKKKEDHHALGVVNWKDQQTGDSDVKKKRLSSRMLSRVLDFNKDHVPSWIWESNSETQWQYIRGLYIGDGTANMSPSKGSPMHLALASIRIDLLKDVQILLSNLGVNSCISMMHDDEQKLLPDGKGGQKYYKCKPCFRLVTSNKPDALLFEKNTGFLSRKNILIEDREYRDNTKKSVKISSIEKIENEDVFCLTTYTDDHVFCSQGLVTGNCSEILLHIDNEHTFVCCLSSMNLSKWEEWKDTDAVKLAIYFLDGVMEEFIAKTENKKGFERARAFAIKSRALGLGAFGWHTLLQEKGMSFDELQSSILNNLIFKTIREQAEEATSELAEQYGEPKWCEGYGRRNTHLIAIAPTVTNSVICGGVSPGIEPLPSNAFTQKTAKGTFLRKNKVLEKILDKKGLNTPAVWKTIINNDGSVQNLAGLSEEEKNIFKTARELNQFDLVRLAAQRQKHIDQGQSLNLFFPSNVDPKYLNRVHIEAWRQGVCTLYYMRTSSVLKGDSGSREYKREMSDCVGCEG